MLDKVKPLQYFVLQYRGKTLLRNYIRLLREIKDKSTKRDILYRIIEEFRSNAKLEDVKLMEEKIKDGEEQLKSLQEMLNLTK
jgi:hypothetical protein